MEPDREAPIAPEPETKTKAKRVAKVEIVEQPAAVVEAPAPPPEKPKVVRKPRAAPKEIPQRPEP